MTRLPASVPELSTLDFFVTVVDTGSLSQAAVRHHISQPSGSARISRLERRIGCRLLERNHSGCRPTEVGLKLAEEARHVLEAAAEFARAIRSLEALNVEPLRIGASYTIGDYVLPRWLSELSPRLSNVSVEVTNSTQTIVHVLQGVVDLGFMCVPNLDDPVEYCEIGSDELVVVASPEHPWSKRRTPLKPEELAAASLIVRDQESGMRSQLDRMLEPFRPEQPPAPLLQLGSTNAIKTAVLRGLGPAVLSRLTVGLELESRKLVEVPLSGIDLRRSLFAIWLEGTELSEAGRTLVDFARSPAGHLVGGMETGPQGVGEFQLEAHS